MNKRLSAIDAISPAFDRTARLLFKPFRLGVWVRLGLIALTTGEFAGGGGAANFNIPSRPGGPSSDDLLAAADPIGPLLRDYLPWIVAGVLVLGALGLGMLYIASIFRFILFDAVLRDRPGLREGWRRWQEPGGNFFLWQLGFLLCSLTALALLVGLPILFAWRAGIFQKPGDHTGLLIGGGLLLFFVALGLILLLMLIGVLAKDFLVPLMALENLSVFQAWGRLLPLLAGEKLAYGGYILMKIVLAVGSAILFSILNLILFLVLGLVVAIIAAVLFIGGWAAGLEWTLRTILAAVALGALALAGLFYLISFVSSPAVVFFQAYALYFLSARYPLLASLLESSPPAPLTSALTAPPPLPSPSS